MVDGGPALEDDPDGRESHDEAHDLRSSNSWPNLDVVSD